MSTLTQRVIRRFKRASTRTASKFVPLGDELDDLKRFPKKLAGYVADFEQALQILGKIQEVLESKRLGEVLRSDMENLAEVRGLAKKTEEYLRDALTVSAYYVAEYTKGVAYLKAHPDSEFNMDDHPHDHHLPAQMRALNEGLGKAFAGIKSLDLVDDLQDHLGSKPLASVKKLLVDIPTTPHETSAEFGFLDTLADSIDNAYDFTIETISEDA